MADEMSGIEKQVAEAEVWYYVSDDTDGASRQWRVTKEQYDDPAFQPGMRRWVHYPKGSGVSPLFQNPAFTWVPDPNSLGTVERDIIAAAAKVLLYMLNAASSRSVAEDEMAWALQKFLRQAEVSNGGCREPVPHYQFCSADDELRRLIEGMEHDDEDLERKGGSVSDHYTDPRSNGSAIVFCFNVWPVS